MTVDVIDVMGQVQNDCAADATALDGTPFTGRAVAETFGATLAMLAVVARAVEQLAREAGAGDD